MDWKITSWWATGEYKGRHRERFTSYTMGYIRDYHGVPTKRQPTYKIDPEAPQERPQPV